jgi:hypothetical protein
MGQNFRNGSAQNFWNPHDPEEEPFAPRGTTASHVTLLDIEPGPYGYTSITRNGWVSDRFPGPLRVLWRLDRKYAVSDGLPGVRIPNASFPGVVTTLPGPEQAKRMLKREAQLKEAGGTVSPPLGANASPASLCGPEGSHAGECQRTFPRREHGGNMDIRYFGVGVTRRVRALAKTRHTSTSRMIADLVEAGLDAEEQERRRFLDLADRLTHSRDPEEREHLKEELARMTFGS